MVPRLSAILLCLLLASLPGPSTAAFERSIFQYTHQRWSEESDAPRPVLAFAQDARGYLWIATALGVFRFDGLRFEAISTGIDLVVHGPPTALLVRRNGDIWVNFERSGHFAVYRHGRMLLARAPPSPDRVQAMREAEDGTVWVLTEAIEQPLLRFRHGQWTSFGIEAGAPSENPFSMEVTRDGTVWLTSTASVMRLAPHGSHLQIVRRKESALWRLSMDPEGRIWLSERAGSYPITGPGGRGDPPPLRYAYATDSAQVRGRPAFDRQGNLWIATYYDGLQRVARPDPRGAASPAEAAARVERFTTRDGLSSNVTSQIFQDMEGNVWVATENGLDRFWPATLRFEPQLTEPAAFGDLFLRASDGSVYIGQASTVYRVRPGGRPEPILQTSVEPRTLCEAPDGAIWIGTDDKDVVIWRDGRIRRLGRRAPVLFTIYDCAFDAAGDYWVTAWRGGMARFRAGRWERMFGPASNSFLPRSMETDRQGRLVVHWNDRMLSRIDGRVRRTVAIPHGSYEPDDVALFPTPSDTIFVGGRFGLARLRDGRMQSISARRVPAFGGLNGMVQTSAGESWLAGPEGLLRVTSAQLDQAFSAPGRMPTIQMFGAADGLRSRPHSHSRRSLVQGGDGRIWAATQTGTLWFDPADISRSLTPPAVAVGALSADRLYRDPDTLTLPAGTSDIMIDFAVLNFSNARAARVRYRMEGQDADWIEAGMRRQAFYTNLAPGTYRFRVVAANDSGIWNERGDSVEFVIPPTFTQSRWFLLLCVLGAMALIWVLARWRYSEAMRQFRNRLEERVRERERIARDLHDTLLQGVQGLVLSFQAVADRLPRSAADKVLLQTTLDQADEIISEGRERVRALRTHDAADLDSVIRELVDAHPLDPSIAVVFTAHGRPRAVHPFVAAEIALIGGEALFNIGRHARAKRVEISVAYDRQKLTVRFRDDGVGIPEDVLESGERPGHYGLVGMRERTERLGGDFSIDSRPGEGTEIVVALTAKLAFLDTQVVSFWKRLGDLLRGVSQDPDALAPSRR